MRRVVGNNSLTIAFMTWVKICGTTNLDDALLAVDSGADAVGFVFYEKSPRNIALKTAAEIIARLPETVEKVGVFVKQSAEQVTAIADKTGLNAIQLYPFVPGESPALVRDLFQRPGRRLFIAVPAERMAASEQGLGFFFSSELLEHISALFLDSGDRHQPGGTGKTFNWNRAAAGARAMGKNVPLVVAGGLTPRNVAEALHLFTPWGVDVVSGVELEAGKKDPAKVRAFVQAVREIDKKAG
jgi:phosphoribosylanthranilate isomerase